MNHRLPETASLLAIYLREATGNQRVYARVILPDDSNNSDPDGRAYIMIGELHGGDAESELFNLFAPQGDYARLVPPWSLMQLVYDPGSRTEPPFTDVVDLLSGSLHAVFAKLAEVIFREQLAGAQQGFGYDRDHWDELNEMNA